MEAPLTNAPKSNVNLFTGLFLIAGLLLIYYAYRYLYTASNVLVQVIISDKISAPPTTTLPTIPQPLEGGEYTVNSWVYISSMNKNYNTCKHIFELKGAAFSTLLIGLGAFHNNLMVRVHTKDPMSLGGNPGAANSGGPASLQGSQGDTSLTPAEIDSLFAPMTNNNGLLNTANQVCDLPDIDLQRWVLVTVVMSGRTTDVYLDGKLSRSCVSKSYYRVDPTGVKPVFLDRGGFDGYVAGTTVANYAMNPGEIYRTYSAGPTGGNKDIITWLANAVGLSK
jgi:hypothetical protein